MGVGKGFSFRFYPVLRNGSPEYLRWFTKKNMAWPSSDMVGWRLIDGWLMVGWWLIGVWQGVIDLQSVIICIADYILHDCATPPISMKVQRIWTLLKWLWVKSSYLGKPWKPSHSHSHSETHLPPCPWVPNMWFQPRPMKPMVGFRGCMSDEQGGRICADGHLPSPKSIDDAT